MRAVSLTLLGAAFVVSACGAPEQEREQEQEPITYEEFKAQVYKEPWEGGIWIVDGDMPVQSEEELRALYEDTSRPVGESTGGLLVYNIAGTDIRWSPSQAVSLTYCVDRYSFGGLYQPMVDALNTAAQAWESSARVNFIHNTSLDYNCNSTQTGVLFNVRYVTGQPYIARAFFPNASRGGRELLINNSAFGNIGAWTLAGVMRHELGHILGFRHEHIRVGQTETRCMENSEWRALTAYDSLSVMHYTFCRNSTNTGDLRLTPTDRYGAGLLYPF